MLTAGEVGRKKSAFISTSTLSTSVERGLLEKFSSRQVALVGDASFCRIIEQTLLVVMRRRHLDAEKQQKSFSIMAPLEVAQFVIQ